MTSTNCKKVAYISTATDLNIHWVRFCPHQQGQFLRLHKTCSTRDRSISRSLQRLLSTKSPTISQVTFFHFAIKTQNYTSVFRGHSSTWTWEYPRSLFGCVWRQLVVVCYCCCFSKWTIISTERRHQYTHRQRPCYLSQGILPHGGHENIQEVCCFCCCCLRNIPLFLPNDVTSTPTDSVLVIHPRDTNYVVYNSCGHTVRSETEKHESRERINIGKSSAKFNVPGTRVQQTRHHRNNYEKILNK